MQLFYFLAVVISLSFGSLPHAAPDFGRSVLFSTLVIAVWWIMCFLSARLVFRLVQQGDVNADVGFDWFDRQTACLRWFSIALIVLCLGGFRLGRSIEQLPWVSESLTLQAIFLLTPTTLIVSALWAAEYWFAFRLGLTTSRWRAVCRWMWQMVRSNLAWLVLPILFILLAVDTVAVVPLESTERVYLLAGILVIVAVFGIPVMIRRVFPTAEVDDATFNRIAEIMHAAGLRSCSLVIWDTNNRTHNAMIAGFFGRFQALFLTDRLVRELTASQLSMVILHEVAHARRRHALLRVFALVPAWLLGFFFQFLILRFAPNHELASWSTMLGNLIGLLATVFILRCVSYYCEYDADAVACRLAPRLAQSISCVPATVEEAGKTLTSALVRVTDGCERACRPSWLHPGVSQRIDAVAAC